MRDSRRLHSTILPCVEPENIYAWCEESYVLAKVGEIGHFVNDVGCTDGDDPRNTRGRNLFRI